MITSTSTTDFLVAQGLPGADLHALPESTKRFPDGAQYRIEIPSTEGPECLEAVLEEAARLEVPVQRVSQGSGVFMLTDTELDRMATLSRERVRRARLGLELLARSGYLARGSQPEPADLAVPQC